MRVATIPCYIISIVMIGATLWPLFREPRRDSFPLSDYPMFTRARPASISIDHVVGIDARGEAVPIPPGIVAKGEVLQAKVMITRTVRRGKRASARLCTETAAKLAAKASWSHIQRLEVRRDNYRVAPYFSGDRASSSSKVYSRCPIGRQP